ncbi:hypothetical protein M514_24905, partial [Trichuris suis]
GARKITFQPHYFRNLQGLDTFMGHNVYKNAEEAQNVSLAGL